MTVAVENLKQKIKWAVLYPAAAAFCSVFLVVLLLTISPENLWERSKANIAYQAPSQDFRPLLIWDSNGIDSNQIFDVFSAVLGSSFEPVVLAPAERRVEGRMGMFFVDEKGRIERDGRHLGQKISLDGKAFVENHLHNVNWIVYKDRDSLQKVLARIPELKKIRMTEQFSKKTATNDGRPLLFSIPVQELFYFLVKVFVSAYFLFLWTLLVWEIFFEADKPVSGLVLSAAIVLAGLTLTAWVCAESEILKWGIVLGVGMAVAFILRLVLDVRKKKTALKLDGKGILFLVLFFLCLVFTLFNPRFSLTADVHRYLIQGEILSSHSGWPRSQQDAPTIPGHVLTYPYAVGLFYDGLFAMTGLTADKWPCADWRFSIVVLLNQLGFALLNFFPLAVFLESARMIGRKMTVFLILSCLCLPTFWGQTLGVEGVLWPLLLLLMIGLNPFFNFRSGVQWVFCSLLASVLSLVKQDTAPIFLFLLMPAVLTEACFTTKRFRSVFLPLGALFLGLIPLVVFKLLNSMAGIVSLDDFNPVNLVNLREGLPDAGNILAAQFGFLMTWKPAVPIHLMLILGIFFRYRRSDWGRKEWIETLVPVSVFFSFWTFVFLFSNYPSKTDHVWESFNRLWGSALLFLIFKVFYKGHLDPNEGSFAWRGKGGR